ncbi:MAG: hypothetical protein K6G56_03905 [Clostridiales bacterium]|nr:hypothetical protein [Clostridiales bacterium]
MKKLLPFAAAFALLALLMIGVALITKRETVSDGTRDGAVFVLHCPARRFDRESAA